MGREIKFRVWDGRRMREPKRILFDTSVGTVAVFDEGELRNPHLMQYTGLTDDEGQEIYEGDVVVMWSGWHRSPEDDHFSARAVVGWCAPRFVFVGSRREYPPKNEGGENVYMRVVGNVHENPELVEQEAA